MWFTIQLDEETSYDWPHETAFWWIRKLELSIPEKKNSTFIAVLSIKKCLN